MTPNTPSAATHGASQAAAPQRRGGPGDAMEQPMSLQALFAALLADSGHGAGEGAPGDPADGAAGNGLPAGLPPDQPSAWWPAVDAGAGSVPRPGPGSASVDGVPGDPSGAGAVLAALLQTDDAAPETRLRAEGRGPGDGSPAPGSPPGSPLDAAMALLEAQPGTAPVADAGPVATAATIGAAFVPEDASVTEVDAPATTRDEARGASLPPALAMAFAAIARADAAAAGEAGVADEARPPLAAAPSAPSLPTGHPAAAPVQSTAGIVPPGAEQITYVQQQSVAAPGAPTGLQQALRDALAQAGGATTDGRTSIDAAQGASPIATGAVQSAPVGVERPTPVWTVSTPMHHAQQWADEVGDRIRWMAGQQVQSAELNITPPDLGAIKVRISVHQDQMTISFSSPNAQVRETLEEAIPRLRDLMSGSGYDAVDVDVSHDRPGDRGNDRGEDPSLVAGGSGGGGEGGPEVIETSIDRRSGGLDLYA